MLVGGQLGQLTQPAMQLLPHLRTPASVAPQPRVSLQGGLGGRSAWEHWEGLEPQLAFGRSGRHPALPAGRVVFRGSPAGCLQASLTAGHLLKGSAWGRGRLVSCSWLQRPPCVCCLEPGVGAVILRGQHGATGGARRMCRGLWPLQHASSVFAFTGPHLPSKTWAALGSQQHSWSQRSWELAESCCWTRKSQDLVQVEETED